MKLRSRSTQPAASAQGLPFSVQRPLASWRSRRSTKAGRAELAREQAEWRRIADAIRRVLDPKTT